jgi:hypothetical protein
VRDDRHSGLGVAGSDETGTVLAETPRTMAAWTGLLAGSFSELDEGIDEALSTLQAELDREGREARYRLQLEAGQNGAPHDLGAHSADVRTTATAWAGVLVGVLAPIVILLSVAPALGLAATLVFVLAGIGPGIMCWVDTGDSYAQAALTVALGMAAFALTAAGMIWLAAWHPTALLLLAVPSVLSCGYRLRTKRLVPAEERSGA